MGKKGEEMYTFIFVNPNGSSPAFDFSDTANTGTACDEAFRLLQQRSARTIVEVWDERDCVAVIRQDAEALPGFANSDQPMVEVSLSDQVAADQKGELPAAVGDLGAS